MATLVKNLFFSSFICAVILTLIHIIGNTITINNPAPHPSSFAFIFPAYSFLVFQFTIWPILQTILFTKFYGFKSILITLISFVIIFISIQAGWYLFFGIVKLLIGQAFYPWTFISASGLYISILFVQIVFFLSFIYRPKGQHYQA
jgi:hypothetical protein